MSDVILLLVKTLQKVKIHEALFNDNLFKKYFF